MLSKSRPIFFCFLLYALWPDHAFAAPKPADWFEHQRTERKKACEVSLRALFSRSKHEYLGQGAEGVVYRITEPAGKTFIAKRFHGNKEMALEAFEVLEPFAKDPAGTGIRIIQLQPTKEPALFTYEDAPGELLSKFRSDPLVMKRFRVALGKFVAALRERYAVDEVSIPEDFDSGGGGATIVDKSDGKLRIVSLSFKLANFKYDPQTQIFTMFDPL